MREIRPSGSEGGGTQPNESSLPLSTAVADPGCATAVPAVFRLAVDGLRGLGTCILVGSARAGTEVSFEMPWLQGGRTVRGVIQGDSRPRDFIPRLVDLFMAGRMPLDRLITRYDFADINRAAADATSGAAIKPVLLLPH